MDGSGQTIKVHVNVEITPSALQAIVENAKVIAGKDQHLIHIPTLQKLFVLPHRIGRALKPARAVGCLLGSQHFHKPTAKIAGEVVGAAEVAVQRLAVELGENINLVDARINAVADWYIDESVFAPEGYCRFGAGEGEGLQPGAGATAENDRQYSH